MKEMTNYYHAKGSYMEIDPVDDPFYG